MLKEISLEKNHKVSIKNKYNYDLVVFNGTIKGKSGYFIRVDKQTYGPFIKLIKETMNRDGDTFFICMADAVNYFVARVGVYGFEIVEELDFTSKLAKSLRRKDMSEVVDGVEKIGQNGPYNVYQTNDKKIFVEKIGMPIKDLAEYEMFDSYLELYLHHLTEHGDNVFFDVSGKFNRYNPQIFNQIYLYCRKEGVYDVDALGRHTLESTKAVAERMLKIINQLKSKASMEELRATDSELIAPKSCYELEKINKLNLDSMIDISYEGNYYTSDDAIKFALNSALPDEVVLSRRKSTAVKTIYFKIGGKSYIFKDDECKEADVNYLNSSDAFSLLDEKVEKRVKACNKALMKRYEKFESKLTKHEFDMLDYICMSESVPFGKEYEIYKKLYAHADTYTVDEINSIMRGSAEDEENYQTLSGKWHAWLSTKHDFVEEAKRFEEDLREKDFDLFALMYRGRRVAFCNARYCHFTPKHFSEFLFRAKTLRELEEIIAQPNAFKKAVEENTGSTNNNYTNPID